MVVDEVKSGEVLPAYAGMILQTVILVLFVVGAPRIRGDDPTLAVSLIRFVMCSPHTRG